MRAARLFALATIALASVGACGGGSSGASDNGSWAPAPTTADGLTRLAYTDGERFLLPTGGGERTFIPGVNVGATVPGTFPGELAASAADYRRWFAQIAGLGLRAIRVYTILPPHFYAELTRYNRAHADAPLYLIQGVWIPEEQFLAARDLYADEVRTAFKNELTDASDAVHGRLERTRRRGTAWGVWTADVSPWLLAYSIGVEWDPAATAASEKKNGGREPFSGRYFAAAEAASSTESWLAEMLDHLAAAEAARGLTVPLTFTNWPTTDPLSHPEEPLQREDLVGIDAAHIRHTSAWPGGYFASFHAYPYYPDFQRHEPALQTYEHEGRVDPYAGYIAALRQHLAGMPLMITEFGVPSSMGLAHTGPLGRDQGNHSEQEAMSINADLMRIIHAQGCSGGFLFEWTDEWFKFTWNTIDYELPGDRRQLWRNPLTNEEHFGLLAMEPGTEPAVTIDGSDEEWSENRSRVIYEGRSGVREVRAVKDEAFLYLRLLVDDADAWRDEPVVIGVDVLPGGSGGLPNPGAELADSALGARRGQYPKADYAIILGPGERGRAYVRASNDQYVILYGRCRGYVDYDPARLEAGSGVWNLQRLITNRPLTVPSSGERLPVESFAVGDLSCGTTSPNADDFDSRNVWITSASASGAGPSPCVLEVRLPWAMIGFADPSRRLALRVGPDGDLSTQPVRRVGIAVSAAGTTAVTNGYAWEPWQRATWHERQKAGIDVLAQAVRDVQSP